MDRICSRIVPVGVALVLAGCANYIHKVDTVSGAQVISLDAKQRAVLTSERPDTRLVRKRDGTLEKQFVASYRAFCAEPSPDVFSVLSQALSASGSLGRDAASANAAVQAAFGSTETGSTIPRTQTINMLRELMYRTCERYLSGALDELQFPVQAVRDQHLMVSILAIEQLTGVVTPPTVTLTGTASASAGQSSSEAVVRLDDAWKALQSADKTLNDAKSAYQKLEDKDPKCSALQTKFDSGATLDPATEVEKRQQCVDAQAKVNAAESARRDAASHYDVLKAAAANGGASASGDGKANVVAGQKPDAQTIVKVADAVTAIVGKNFEQDEFELFCIRVMNQDADPSVVNTCTEYVESAVAKKTAKLKKDSAQLKLDTDRINEIRKKIEKQNQSKFDKFWPKVASTKPEIADTMKLKALIDGYIRVHFPGNKNSITKEQLTDLGKLSGKKDIANQFGMLDPEVQDELSSN